MSWFVQSVDCTTWMHDLKRVMKMDAKRIVVLHAGLSNPMSIVRTVLIIQADPVDGHQESDVK